MKLGDFYPSQQSKTRSRLTSLTVSELDIAYYLDLVPPIIRTKKST
jgi:hypothetical protein